MGNFLLVFSGLNQGALRVLEIVFIVRKAFNPGFFLHKRKSLPGKRGTFSLGFSRLFQAFQETGYFQFRNLVRGA